MRKFEIELHFIIIILSFTAILGKLIHIDTLSMLFFRTSIASIGILIWISLRKQKIHFDRRDLFKLCLVAALLSIHWFTFFYSARISTVAISLVMLGTTSFFSSLMEPFILKTPFKKRDMGIGLLAFIGVLIIFGYEPQYVMGSLLGILSAILAALFSLLNACLTKKLDGKIISLVELGMASAYILSFIIVSPLRLQLPVGNDWIWIACLGIICTVYPYVRMVDLLKHIEVFKVNLALNLEPVYGIILAFLVFGQAEQMGTPFYIGASIILASMFIKK